MFSRSRAMSVAFALSPAESNMALPVGTAVGRALSGVWMSLVVSAITFLNVKPEAWLLAVESWVAAGGVILLLVTAHTAIMVLLFGRGRLVVAGVTSPVTAAIQLGVLAAMRNVIGI